MTDSPKPITPEFVRGWQAAATHLCGKSNHHSTPAYMSDWLDYSTDVLSNEEPDVDPLAAAKERLGAWLVEDHRRRFRMSLEGEQLRCRLSDNHGIVSFATRSTEAEAINAALDAAERGDH